MAETQLYFGDNNYPLNRTKGNALVMTSAIQRASADLARYGNTKLIDASYSIYDYFYQDLHYVTLFDGDSYPDSEFWAPPTICLVSPELSDETGTIGIGLNAQHFIEGPYLRPDASLILQQELPRIGILLSRFFDGDGAYTPNNSYVKDIIGANRDAVIARSEAHKELGKDGKADHIIKGPDDEKRLVIQAMGAAYYTACSLEDMRNEARSVLNEVLTTEDVSTAKNQEYIKVLRQIAEETQFPTQLGVSLIRIFTTLRDILPLDIYNLGIWEKRAEVMDIAVSLSTEAEEKIMFEAELAYQALPPEERAKHAAKVILHQLLDHLYEKAHPQEAEKPQE